MSCDIKYHHPMCHPFWISSLNSTTLGGIRSNAGILPYSLFMNYMYEICRYCMYIISMWLCISVADMYYNLCLCFIYAIYKHTKLGLCGSFLCPGCFKLPAAVNVNHQNVILICQYFFTRYCSEQMSPILVVLHSKLLERTCEQGTQSFCKKMFSKNHS